jgi:hypothetical protein
MSLLELKLKKLSGLEDDTLPNPGDKIFSVK